MNKFSLVAAFGVALGIGFLISQSVELKGTERSPAAVRKNYDFTNLRGSALEIALKERLITQVNVQKNESDVAFSLGHFAFTNSNNSRVLGCSVYQKVVLEFESADMAISGEKSKMEVSGACRSNEDGTMIQPLRIPFSKIHQDRPSDGDYQFTFEDPIFVRFSNVSESWPRSWHLVGVKLLPSTRPSSESNENSEAGAQTQEIIVDRNEVQKILGRPLTIEL